MNYAKGARTRGRGKSAKHAIAYYAHDKDGAETAHRVGFIVMRNLVADNPEDAWREMMVTCDMAPELKRQSGAGPGGNKTVKPYYAFSINWHPDDNPGKQHMIDSCDDALQTLGLQDRQAIYFEHIDEPHPHVHILVNLIHPQTGMTPKLSNDQYRLDRWCDTYEVKMGVIRSPERRAKFAALDQGMEPPQRIKQPKHFNDPVIKAAIANDNATAKARRQAIQAEIRAYQARLKKTQGDAFKRRRAEQRALWNDYRTACQAIRSRHQFEIDKIYKHKRNRHALPLSIQIL
jgi:hypothetical protein